MSELDKLTARRRSLSRSRHEETLPIEEVDSHDSVIAADLGDGLEYLYDVREARDSYDNFHIILLGS